MTGPLTPVAVAGDSLAKQYGDVHAVRGASVTATPGQVTVLVGGNGAGKSTTLGLMLSLVRGSGRTLFDGRPLTDHAQPHRIVGAFLGQPTAHPRRSARSHLRVLAAGTDVPRPRIDELLDFVGLHASRTRSPQGFSTGMAQRLGIATALLHDPSVLVLDEPLNGLDPDGVILLRDLLRAHAARGGTVLMASHQLDEVERVADVVYMMEAGRVVSSGPVRDVARGGTEQVVVRSDDDSGLALALRSRGARVDAGDGLTVHGLSTREIALAARGADVLITELVPVRESLTQRYERRAWSEQAGGAV
jgi:ABC-2 type transport system ATP-binding protein